MSKWHYVKVTLCQSDIMSKWHYVKVTLCQSDIMSKWHFVKVTFCQSDILSKWHFIKVTFCQNDILSKWHFVKITFCLNIILSKWHCVKVISRQIDILLKWYLAKTNIWGSFYYFKGGRGLSDYSHTHSPPTHTPTHTCERRFLTEPKKFNWFYWVREKVTFALSYWLRSKSRFFCLENIELELSKLFLKTVLGSWFGHVTKKYCKYLMIMTQALNNLMIIVQTYC
jgi:hypothetical protein